MVISKVNLLFRLVGVRCIDLKVRYQAYKIIVQKWVNRCTLLKPLALGMREAANLRSAPGGRHSSYATADE